MILEITLFLFYFVFVFFLNYLFVLGDFIALGFCPMLSRNHIMDCSHCQRVKFSENWLFDFPLKTHVLTLYYFPTHKKLACDLNTDVKKTLNYQPFSCHKMFFQIYFCLCFPRQFSRDVYLHDAVDTWIKCD